MNSRTTTLLLTALAVAALSLPAMGQAKKGAEGPQKERRPNAAVDRYSLPASSFAMPATLEELTDQIKSRQGFQRYTQGRRITSPRLQTMSKSAGSFERMQAVPVPDDEHWYAYPAVVTLANGDILMAYRDSGIFEGDWDLPPIEPAQILVIRSSDNGATWSTPVKVAEGSFALDFYFLTLTMTGSGRLLLTDLTPASADHAYYSDDDGATWNEAPVQELLQPAWHGPIAGDIWQTFTDETTGAVMYMTSSDGLAWSAPKQILANANPSRYFRSATAAVDAGGGHVLVAIFHQDWDTGANSVYVIRSNDGGNTWRTPALLPTAGLEMQVNRFALNAGGEIVASVQGSVPCCPDPWDPFAIAGDIYTMTSVDLGATWTEPVAFTEYVGGDYQSDMTLTADGLFNAFTSDRGGIWYGIVGMTSDAGSPPAFADWLFPFDGVPVGRTVDVAVAAAAASGLDRVELIVSVNGEESVIPLSMGGSACAYLAQEVCWTGSVGPFALGDELFGAARAVDVNGLETMIEAGRQIPILPIHDVGSAEMVVGPSAYFNRVIWQDDDYLCCDGGPAAGFDENEVLPWDWQPVPGFTPTSGPGKSDQDISLAYHADNLGLTVEQRSYQWSETALADGIIFEYEYANTGTVGDIQELYAALYADADLVNDWLYWDDLIGYSSTHNVLYMYDSGDLCAQEGIPCPEGYIGFALLRDASGTPGKGLTPHTATWNWWEDTFFNTMTSGINPALSSSVSPDDYTMLLTAQPFALPVGASRTVTFAMVFGGSLSELLANVDAIEEAYNSRVVGVERAVSSEIPAEYALGQNYPNPFNPATTISFSLPKASNTTLTVYNLLGEEVATLVSEDLRAGVHDVSWDASGLASGIYMYRLTAGDDYRATRSLILLK